MGIRRIAKLLLDRNFRLRENQRAELRRIPRYTKGVTHLLGYPVTFVDSLSFINMYDEIFGRQIYRFKCESEVPFILDCGSNIGLSVLYFKQIYPHSRILAFEADPLIAEVLKSNIQSASLAQVEIVQKAVWDEQTVLNFMREGADAGRLDCLAEGTEQCGVETIRLRNYLSQPIDFLKMDIEGAELRVLKDCCDQLKNVKRLFVEYHSFENSEQKLDELLSVLKQAGFRIFCDQPIKVRQPFFELSPYLGMDLQLNIYAFREHE